VTLYYVVYITSAVLKVSVEILCLG
jgi:hypothetical protein